MKYIAGIIDIIIGVLIIVLDKSYSVQISLGCLFIQLGTVIVFNLGSDKE